MVNFGTFTIKQRAAREGRNPQTGEKINIRAAKVVGFKAGKALKEAVKGEKEERDRPSILYSCPVIVDVAWMERLVRNPGYISWVSPGLKLPGFTQSYIDR